MPPVNPKPMNRMILFLALVCCALSGFTATSARAQSEPLARSYVQGATQRYRVELLVRSELEGQRPVRVGVKGYAEPFTQFAQTRIAWTVTQRVVAVLPDGSAEIEEFLDGFAEPESRAATEGDPELKNLACALEDALRRWSQPRVLRYVATRAGQLRGFAPAGAPALDEAGPALLTPWLLLALRPAASLPARPIRFGERWQEPRAVRLENWTDVQGTESGEWLEALGSAEPVVRLLIVQHIAGNVAAGKERSVGGDGADSAVASVAGRFHAESLATLSLTDRRLLAATRSATREITWTLAPREGFEQPPRFHARLSAQVTIEECGDGCR